MASLKCSRLRLKCDGTRPETRFRLSAKRTSPFKSAGASVQSTAGSRVVRISGSNAGYTMFRVSVKSTGYPRHSPFSPFTSPPVRHRVPSHFNWTLRLIRRKQQQWGGLYFHTKGKTHIIRQNVKLDYENFSYLHNINVLLALMNYEIRTNITRKFCAHLIGNGL